MNRTIWLAGTSAIMALQAILTSMGSVFAFYLQWISSLLTNILIPLGVSDALDTNSIFLFAVFIATAKSTASSGGLRPAEAFIMLQMCFGYLLSVVSVTGLRITLLSDPHSLDLDQILTEFRKGPTSLSTFSHRPTWEKRLLEQIRHRPPEGVQLPRDQQAFLRALDLLALLSNFHAVGGPTLFQSAWIMLEPILWGLDFYVMILLQTKHELRNVQHDPVRLYRHSRLKNYQECRAVARTADKHQLFSLGMKSAYKHDQLSWFGVFWRACLVGGVSIYNIWFWFAGIPLLSTDSCPIHIFLFCKVSMFGRARIFFKIVAVTYAIFGGALILVGLATVLAFFATTMRSLLINLFLMPYARIVLFLASTGNRSARNILDNFEESQNTFLNWLDIPNLRQLLRGFACLSSNPKDTDSTEQPRRIEKPSTERRSWYEMS
jgi:hypothetical protein